MRRLLLSLILLIGSPAWASWAVVQHAVSGTCVTTSATCDITVASTGSGHVIVIGFGILSNAEQIVSVSGGGTYTHPAGCYGVQSTTNGSDCAYTLSSTSGATTITVTRTDTTTFAWRVEATELSFTGVSAIVDTGSPATRAQTTNTTSPAGVTLTLAGSSDAIYQIIWGSIPTAVSSPYSTYQDFSGNSGFATSINTSSGTAPAWTQDTAQAALSAIAFTEISNAATPTFYPGGGTSSSALSVAITSSTTGALICYGLMSNPQTTGDGINCTTGTPLANGGSVTVNVSETLYAVAGTASLADSAVASAAYVITTSYATISPNTLTYAAQQTGTTSFSQTVTLTNGGTTNLNIASISITGDFAQTNTCPSVLSGTGGLNPSCTISVTFTPTTTGTRTGTLTVTDDSGGVGGSTQTVSLTGTGQVAPNPGRTRVGRFAAVSGSGGINLVAVVGSPAPPPSSGDCFGIPLACAALPIKWVDDTVCNPPGGTYYVDLTLGTSVNNGPNVAGEALGAAYALTPAGLLDACYNWRDNGGNTIGGGYLDKSWRIKIPSGTVLHCTSSDFAGVHNGNCISLPGKANPSTGVEPTQCLTLESTTPLTAGVMACGRGLPGFGGARNPGCDGHTNPGVLPNDKASMWTVMLDVVPATGDTGIEASVDPVTSTNVTNHIVIRDVEITTKPGAAPSKNGSTVPVLFHGQSNPLATRPASPLSVNYVGLDRFYVHGWDPGDSGQPTTGSSVDATGNCLSWYNSGTVTTANTDGTHGSVTLTSTVPTLAFGNTFFGPTFTVSPVSTINIGGTMSNLPSGAGGSISGGANYTISDFDPTTSNTVLTINGQPGTQTGVQYLQINPPSNYTPGCGDDSSAGVTFNIDNGWLMNGYIEKIHHWSSETKAATYGFDNGPTKIVNNWMEGGSETLFSGGAPADQNGGPGSDNEIRKNYLGRDLNWRLLTGGAANSPAPPWGCGTFESKYASHNTCPFPWSVKNSFEAKEGHRNLVDGNIIENTWSDGQSGFAVLLLVEATSGGQAAGVFDPATGRPASYLDNVRLSNNWIRNAPNPVQMIGRGDMNTGNGGGTTLPVGHNDFINNLFTNIGDTNQFNTPGHMWQWTSGNGNNYTCAMSYVTVSPSLYTVTANCSPFQTDIKSPAHIQSITVDSSHNVTILHASIRLDPTLSTSAAGTCITSGASWTTCPIIVGSSIVGTSPNTGALSAGSFAMTGTSGQWAGYSDGTGGQTIVYNDPASTPGTVCSTLAACNTAIGSGTLTFASLAGKMIAIAGGDGVYAHNIGGGDTTCADNGYATGSTTANYAIGETATIGLIVKYNLTSAPAPGITNCLVNNGAGLGRFITLQHNTFLSPNNFAITNFGAWHSPISNFFHDNVFATTDTGASSDVYSTAPAGEGTTAFQSWDLASFQFYRNVLENQGTGSNWSVVGCPAGVTDCTNHFPTTVNCATSTADGTCLGYSGFMGSSPTVTYPTGACPNGNAPFNCPLMALPWANNLTLSNLAYDATSIYKTQGVDTTQMNTAMTQNGYVCPAGAYCGTHGPYPDH